MTVSRRKKKHQDSATPVGEISPLAASAGPELLRRILLGLLTAWIVARPLVLGEDPGLLAPWSDTSSLVLTQLWLIGVLGWAIWRWWGKQPQFHLGPVEIGLALTVGLVFVSATGAKYQHPAWLIGWEWLAFLVALFLVRQLAVKEGERNALVAVLLATALTAAGYALFQYGVEFPALRAHLEDELKQSPAGQGVGQSVGVPGGNYLEGLRARVQEQGHAYSTFAHPNTFGGYMALLIPPLLGALVVRARLHAGWRTWATAGGVLLALAGLWVSHSRGALLGVALAALFVLLVLGWRWLRANLAITVTGVLLLAGLGALFIHQGWASSLFGKREGTVQNRLDYWTATWGMITDHPWLGVGPGNFGRYYTQYMVPTAYETITDPHNFLLELTSTSGVFACAALAGTLGLFFLLMLWKWPNGAAQGEPAPPREESRPEEKPSRWAHAEFYAGGMAGLLLGYVLRQTGRSPDEMLWAPLPHPDDAIVYGVTAGVRGVIWFASFALLVNVPWTRRQLGLALTAGVVAVLVNLLVSGGISFPALAGPLWLVIGLALGCRQERALGTTWNNWLALVAPFPVVAGVAVAYLTTVFLPVTRSYGLALKAMAEARFYLTQRATSGEPTESGKRQITNPFKFLLDGVILPLDEAVRDADPGDSHRIAQLGHWYGEAWSVLPRKTLQEKDFSDSISHLALACARVGQHRDPMGTELLLLEYQLRERFAAGLVNFPREQKAHREAAEAAIARLIKLDPTDPRWYYQRASVLSELGKTTECREMAQQALNLDMEQTHPNRRLTPVQRVHINRWLEPRSGGAP